MTVFQGRSGADAIAKAFAAICRTTLAYSGKLDIAIGLAESAEIITSSEAAVARSTLGAITITCDIFKRIADNSGFYPPA